MKLNTLLHHALGIALLVMCSTAILATEAKKPNVMIIFADDVGTGDVPGYWQDTSEVNMVNLSRLVADGVTFTDAHSTPVCAPSRYMLLSGNYQHRGEFFSGTWSLNHSGNQFRHGQKSIAQIFRDNGYRTSMYGKWHLGGKVPSQTNVKTSQEKIKTDEMLSTTDIPWENNRLIEGPGDIGFDESYITVSGIQAPPYAFLRNDQFEDDLWTNMKYWKKGSYMMPEGVSLIQKKGEGISTWDSTAYNMILVNETEKFLDNHIESHPDEPFFTYVALGAVHGPHSPPDEYLDGEKIAGKHDTEHMDLLKEMDKVVGSLIGILENKNVLEDTIIVFTSDNGGVGGNHGSWKSGHQSSGLLRQSKGSMYEGGHRVPMTIRWDNGKIPKGEKRTHIVGLNDLFATLSDMAGIEVPYGQANDSVSFADYLLDESKSQGLREYLGVFRFDNNKIQNSSGSIRKGSMKLIYDYINKTVELYDLSNDISETNDVSADENNAELIREMFDELKKIGPCYDRQNKVRVKVAHQHFKGLKNKSCDWFKKNKVKRCTRLEAIHCGSVCAGKNQQKCNLVYNDLSIKGATEI